MKHDTRKASASEHSRRTSPWRSPACIVPLIALMLTSGCLGHHYEVSRGELERLVQTPPQERGRNIYAVQRFSTAEDPEPAPAWEPPPGEPPPGYGVTHHGHWVPSLYFDFYGTPYYEPPIYRSPVVATAADVHGSSAGGGVHGASPVPDNVTSSSSSGGSSSGGLGNINGVDKLLVVAVVVGVAVGIGLAATEGARYEGSIAVHPHHPVHLWHRDGRQSIVALDELTAADLSTVSEVTLSGEEGAGMWLSGAAPLNRAGFSYQFGAGNDSLALPRGRTERGPGFRFALGYYPTKTFGLLADTRLQFDDNAVRGYYNARLGLEAQWYPLSLWRLHLGPFVGGGQSWSATAGVGLPTTEGTRPYISFGALAELELTTRLGLTFRWTQDWLPSSNPDTRGFVHSWSLGFSVY
ncbi:hypothetical protein D187_005891 [Cystobacter fuscus DSM 2262]|uniref:Uncharacterized protein n=1 Tax=Cystobacter fuscus (strain ATCC 25194 / DSM 2262 / NBRC 100088 / M29) TaxID=1242864 RepID=S9PGK1_CYSF2|nr:hypothetical protein [Cystobacter fuscus]EPX63485.1 hypothetical protein D187_005891 [Cystobacter fuscus DSM 2262]